MINNFSVQALIHLTFSLITLNTTLNQKKLNIIHNKNAIYPTLQSYIDSRKNKEKILIIGCSHGYYGAQHLHEDAYTFDIRSEINPDYIADLNSKDAVESLPENIFDIIIFETIGNKALENYPQAPLNAWKLLKFGGIMYLTTRKGVEEHINDYWHLPIMLRMQLEGSKKWMKDKSAIGVLCIKNLDSAIEFNKFDKCFKVEKRQVEIPSIAIKKNGIVYVKGYRKDFIS